MKGGIFRVLFAAVLVLGFSLVTAVPAAAQSELNVYGYPNRLHVTDGSTNWAEVSIPVDIALKNISSLSFWEKVTSFDTKGWDVNVILGVDCDGDGVFEANLPAWHGIGGTMHDAATLGGDSFVEMDGALGPLEGLLDWTQIDALSTARWWTPNAAGNGLSGSLYCSFSDMLSRIAVGPPTWDTNIPKTDVYVKCVKLVIGGSGSWMGETAYVDKITINGKTYYLTIQRAIGDANPGDTIRVAAGTYNECISIGKALTVRSTDGAKATIIDGTGSYIVIISHSGVMFEGFTVTNPEYTEGADASGILVETVTESISNVQILNNIVTQVRSETGTPSMFGATGINIGYAKTKGFTLNDIVISGNTLTAIKNPGEPVGSSPSDHTCGINVWDGAEGVVISNNTISDIKYNGILLEYASDVQIENNSITLCDAGIRVEASVDATNVSVNFNNIMGNLTYGVYNGGTGILDATNNWWGDKNGPQADPGQIPDGENVSTGDKVSDNVHYDPWIGADMKEVKAKTTTGSDIIDEDDTVSGMGDIDIDATEDHTITTIEYEDNPGGTPAFEATGDYYDVHLDDDTGVNSLTIEFCPATSDTVIYYWNDSSWRACSEQTYSDGCIVVTVTASTFPSLSDLTGLPFAPGTPSPPMAVGGEVHPVNKANVLAPWLGLAVILAIGGSILVMRRSRAN